MDSELKKALLALGVMAETSLNFYRAIISAGGTREEASALTKIMMEAFMSKPDNGGKN